MTCEEFMAQARTVKLEDQTVAERAARHRHVTDCVACRGYLARFAALLPDLLAAEPDAWVRMMALADADMRDPEWREVTGVNPGPPPAAEGGGR